MENRDEVLEAFETKMGVMCDLVRGVAHGYMSGVVISGPPGIGKSHQTVEVLETEFPDLTATIYKGHITPLALYNALQNHANKGSLVVFDDCDNAFEDVAALNLLKGAMDPASGHIVSWASSSHLVELPRFRFHGGIIILTNARLRRSDHYKAFIDRVHCIDLDVTLEEKVAKLAEVAEQQEDVDPETAHEILQFIFENMEALGERVSLRTFARLADLVKLGPKWRNIAKFTVLQDD